MSGRKPGRNTTAGAAPATPTTSEACPARRPSAGEYFRSNRVPLRVQTVVPATGSRCWSNVEPERRSRVKKAETEGVSQTRSRFTRRFVNESSGDWGRGSGDRAWCAGLSESSTSPVTDYHERHRGRKRGGWGGAGGHANSCRTHPPAVSQLCPSRRRWEHAPTSSSRIVLPTHGVGM